MSPGTETQPLATLAGCASPSCGGTDIGTSNAAFRAYPWAVGTRQTRQGHEAVVVEIVYALLTSAALGIAVGLAFFVAASLLGAAQSTWVDATAVGLAFGIWGGRTLLVLLKFDRARRAVL